MDESLAGIADEVCSWAGVSSHPHRFGGVELRLGRRELGHLHPGGVVDLPFTRRIRDMLVETGRAEPHHVLPDTGWVTKRVRSPDDAAEAVELFRLAYERAQVAATRAARGRAGQTGI